MVQVVGERTAVLTLQKLEPPVSKSACSCYDEAIRKTLTFYPGQILTVRNSGAVSLRSVNPEK
jgi:hypothetical protein